MEVLITNRSACVPNLKWGISFGFCYYERPLLLTVF